MKSLIEFIREHNLNESKRTEIRIEVNDIKGSEDFLSKLKSSLDSKDIYNEKIDSGLKFAIQGDNKEKYQDALDILKGWEEGKEKLEGPITELEAWITEEPEENEEDLGEDEPDDEDE
ncbi:MAG: hypothetical protein J1F35_05760 [Erysipelotrichales bacterium]|nr:hypothetical protein [Erysipelotrichales bacterium]